MGQVIPFPESREAAPCDDAAFEKTPELLLVMAMLRALSPDDWERVETQLIALHIKLTDGGMKRDETMRSAMWLFCHVREATRAEA
jgi:hypothetical protein